MTQIIQHVGAPTLVELFTDTAKTSIVVPAWAQFADFGLVGGGGSGGANEDGSVGFNTPSSAGGGGGYWEWALIPVSGLSTITCVIGAGGTAVTMSVTNGVTLAGNPGGATGITGLFLVGTAYAVGGEGGTAGGGGGAGGSTRNDSTTAGGGATGGVAGSGNGADGTIAFAGPDRHFVVNGGGGGGGNNHLAAFGGFGGSASNFIPRLTHSNNRAGNGGASRMGVGGLGGTSGNSGAAPVWGYGGGGGGCFADNGSGKTSGAGANGCIWVKWYG